jgi:formate hydrogenlyase subunit 4
VFFNIFHMFMVAWINSFVYHAQGLGNRYMYVAQSRHHPHLQLVLSYVICTYVHMYICKSCIFNIQENASEASF